MLVQRFSLESELDVDKVGLSIVNSACEQLANGAVRFDELWPGVIPDLTLSFHDLKALENAQGDYWRLKRAAKTMDAMQLSLKTKLRQMHTIVSQASMRSGLQRMPNEILREVVATYEGMVTEELDSRTTLNEATLTEHFAARECIRKLALVNRRFRDIVYALPRCFSDIGFEKPTKSGAVARSLLRIARSRSSGFNILARDKDVLNRSNFLRESKSVCFLQRPQGICDTTGTKLFPKLEKMRIQLEQSPTEEENILASISTPCLKALRLTVLDEPHPEVTSSLTSLNVGPYDFWSESAVLDLFTAIPAIPTLRQLTLHLVLHIEIARTLDLPKAFLHNLECYSLRLATSRENFAKHVRFLLKQISAAFKIPGVKDLMLDLTESRLQVGDMVSINPSMFNNSLLQGVEGCRKLQTLRLLLTRSGKDDEGDAVIWSNCIIPAFLGTIPTIRKFECSLPSLKVFKGVDLLAKLDHLTIHSKDCRSSDIGHLLASILTQEKLWLRTIDFRGYQGNTEDALNASYWQEKLDRMVPNRFNLQLS